MIHQLLETPREIRTDHLVLAPLTPADIDELFAVQSDARTWRHLPTGRPTSRTATEHVVQTAIGSRVRFGLGAWSVRLGADAPGAGLAAGAFLGSGGVTMSAGGTWNLGYRLAPECWGRGYATELARAAVDAAARTRPDTAVTGRVLSNNPASAAVLRKAGLSMVWSESVFEPATPGGPLPTGPLSTGVLPTGVLRQVWSDRRLSDTDLDWLIAHA